MAKPTESAEQDNNACMCKLILLYILRKMNSWSETAGYLFNMGTSGQVQIGPKIYPDNTRKHYTV